MGNTRQILEIQALQEMWDPEQYESWPEPSRSTMMEIAKKFYSMSPEDYKKVLQEGIDLNGVVWND